MKELTIIGSGLAGSLLSLMLAQRGYDVTVYESRPDIRYLPQDFGRSINLALSKRGITGLSHAGVMEKVKPILVPMRARAIHERDGEVKYQAFGRHHDEYINAVKRSELSAVLLNEMDKQPNINVHFEHRLQQIDFENKELIFSGAAGSKVVYPFKHLVGADGAGSVVRQCLVDADKIQASRVFLPHSYKELSILPSYSKTVAQEHLHLWSRHHFMLLGNPNEDGSITATLFMEDEGKAVSFATIDNETKVTNLFSEYFADVSTYMSDLTGDFFKNPVAKLSTVKASPWYYGADCLLIGDAAHGIVPFFGQGMNSAFEDCRILNQLLLENNEDWSIVMPRFYQLRKPNTDAIAAMSMDNYKEIELSVCDKQFNMKKQLEQLLMKRYPQIYTSKHVMVMFTNEDYAYAHACGQQQAILLEQLCHGIDDLAQINWEKATELLKIYDKKLTEIQERY